MNAEDYLQSGDLEKALAALTEQVRKNPAKVELRIFLFQSSVSLASGIGP